jgi:hypothetical protein
MAQFEALVRVFEVSEPDPSAARATVEDSLRKAGFKRWQVVNVTAQGTAARSKEEARRRLHPANYSARGWVMAAAVLWSLWLLWIVAG